MVRGLATKGGIGGMWMRQFCVAAIAAAGLLSAGCGSSDERADSNVITGADSGAQTTSSGDDGSGSGASGTTVVNPPPPGHATVSVDGQQFDFELPGALDCNIETETFTFSYRIGDNEVTLGAGANRYETGWAGNITMIVADPATENGPVTYSPATGSMVDAAFAFDGQSMSYSGPMQKTPPNDGSNPPPIAVGDGTITVTCP